MPVTKKVNQTFFEIWSPEMAYVLGFFAADGNMIRNNRGAHFVAFYSTDHQQLSNVQRVLESDHKISQITRPLPWKNAYQLQIGSKQIFADLISLGFTPRKSSTLKLPHIPKQLFSQFVRGYFDGDGCVYFKQHFIKARQHTRWVFSSRFTAGSRDFLISLQQQLHSQGLIGGFIVNKNRGFELVFSHKDSVALARLMYDTMPCDNLRLERKYKLFQTAIKTLYGDVAQSVRAVATATGHQSITLKI